MNGAIVSLYWPSRHACLAVDWEWYYSTRPLSKSVVNAPGSIVLQERLHVMTRRCVRSGEGEMTSHEILLEYLESEQL
jgi:hypothetical protein